MDIIRGMDVRRECCFTQTKDQMRCAWVSLYISVFYEGERYKDYGGSSRHARASEKMYTYNCRPFSTWLSSSFGVSFTIPHSRYCCKIQSSFQALSKMQSSQTSPSTFLYDIFEWLERTVYTAVGDSLQFIKLKHDTASRRQISAQRK